MATTKFIPQLERRKRDETGSGFDSLCVALLGADMILEKMKISYLAAPDHVFLGYRPCHSFP